MSNPVLEAIASRRSIRAYKDEQITQEQLTAILNAGEQAPSARNQQPWHFTAVQDAALISRVNEAFRAQALKEMPDPMRKTIEDPAYSVFHHAPTVIFLSCPNLQQNAYAMTDNGMAIQNMALAAYSLGLGSVILGMPRLAFQGAEADDLRSTLQFPDGYDYCLSIAIGIPTATKEAHPIEPGHITRL
ncbi:nitroreductase [Eubacteriales bacterium OttesenSCG-928-A19]|nr:nitroreductase [Eubacteriales bacterium OttesenSCG-928-A19]